jgi:hypothetical protein
MPPPLLTCNSISFHCASSQVEEFLEKLSKPDYAKLQAAAQIAANSIESGRPPANRWQRVRASSALFELKITAPGSRGPQLRLLCACDGPRVLLLRGLVKRQRALPGREIKKAEEALAAYRQLQQGPRQRERSRKKQGRA